MTEYRTSYDSLVEGRVSEHHPIYNSFKVEGYREYFRVKTGYARPPLGRHITAVVSPAGFVRFVNVRGRLADRIIRSHNHEQADAMRNQGGSA